MRNPLSAILQLADGILNSMEMPVKGKPVELTAETADHIIDSAQTVMLCAQHQKTIIDDILTIVCNNILSKALSCICGTKRLIALHS